MRLLRMMLNENRVTFKSGDLALEGLFAFAGRRAALLAHPHPMLGGNMRDNVLMALAEAFRTSGYSTLRFNFRGTGRSEGVFDHGRGETEDLLAAADFLKSMGYEEIVLAGYSFGAWVCCRAACRQKFSDLIMVSPPLGEFDFDFSRCRAGLALAGDADPFCAVDDLQAAACAHSFQVDIIAGADHFFFGRERALIEKVALYLENKNR